jgi:hypothetical protein
MNPASVADPVSFADPLSLTVIEADVSRVASIAPVVVPASSPAGVCCGEDELLPQPPRTTAQAKTAPRTDQRPIVRMIHGRFCTDIALEFIGFFR